MIALCPATLISTAPDGARWFRLARADDGRLCLESISNLAWRAAHSMGFLETASWTFCADVPPYIAKRLAADNDRDQVARVLDRALKVLSAKKRKRTKSA